MTVIADARVSLSRSLDTSKAAYQLPQPTGMMPEIFLGAKTPSVEPCAERR